MPGGSGGGAALSAAKQQELHEERMKEYAELAARADEGLHSVMLCCIVMLYTYVDTCTVFIACDAEVAVRQLVQTVHCSGLCKVCGAP
jgi:hypothetical protein